MTAKTPMTGAERVRRHRERQKASEDIVRAFLSGVVEDAQHAVEADNAPEWLLARSASAIEVLDSLTREEEVRPPLLLNLVCVAAGAATVEERKHAIAAHEAAFVRWLRASGKIKGKAEPTGRVLQLARAQLAYANEKRVARESTAALMTVGLNAAKRLVRTRMPGTAEDFRIYTAPVQLAALRRITSGKGLL